MMRWRKAATMVSVHAKPSPPSFAPSDQWSTLTAATQHCERKNPGCSKHTRVETAIRRYKTCVGQKTRSRGATAWRLDASIRRVPPDDLARMLAVENRVAPLKQRLRNFLTPAPVSVSIASVAGPVRGGVRSRCACRRSCQVPDQPPGQVFPAEPAYGLVQGFKPPESLCQLVRPKSPLRVCPRFAMRRQAVFSARAWTQRIRLHASASRAFEKLETAGASLNLSCRSSCAFREERKRHFKCETLMRLGRLAQLAGDLLTLISDFISKYSSRVISPFAYRASRM
jgi:hypothetical protein